MIKEDEIPTFLCFYSSTHACSVWSRICPIAKWTSLYHMLVKVTNLPKNVQVSWSLLELCRRHVVVLQAQILQVVNIRQLVDKSLMSFTI